MNVKEIIWKDPQNNKEYEKEFNRKMIKLANKTNISRKEAEKEFNRIKQELKKKYNRE